MTEFTSPDTAQDNISSSISTLAHAYQLAMSQQSVNPPLPAYGIETLARDVAMAGTSTPDRAPSPANPNINNAPSPLPRTGTPSRTNGDAASRSTSVHPDSSIPRVAAPNGAPARRYMNEKITPHLMEGMKKVVSERPEDPLRMLGEYLLQKSREVEGA